MDKRSHQIVIVGGGTAGITVASQLLRKDSRLDVAIVEPSDKHYYQPAWTLVGAGTFNMAKTEREERSVMPKGVQWVKDYVSEIVPNDNRIQLKSGEFITYEYLVLAPGIQIDLDGISGLKDAIGKDGVCSNYIDPEYTWKVMQDFKGGNALFAQAATPIKCGGAPQKIMYLAGDYFKKKGIEAKTNIIYALPGGVIFGVPDFAKTLMNVVDRHEIVLKFKHNLKEIDHRRKKAVYEVSAESIDDSLTYNDSKNRIGEVVLRDALVEIPYDMLHLAPPQSAPDFIKRSDVAYQSGDNKGWIEVDIHSLQHKRYSNIFGLGDAAALPTAKTGAAVRKQAPVVVDNILNMIKGKPANNKGYQGYSSCPLVTGYGKMVLAEFGYENKRMSDPLISKFVDTTKENWSMWMLKKYGLPFMYWDLMLKGKA